jgi:hypothetical protein
MLWRIVKDSLLVGRYTAVPVTPLAAQGKRKVAAFDFVSPSATSVSPGYHQPATDI